MGKDDDGQDDLFDYDLFGAKIARDEALDNVDPEWLASAIASANENLPDGFEGITERMRLILTGRFGLADPPHHNNWGGFTREGIRLGLLRDTGRIAHMRTRKSHGRRSPVYRKYRI